MEHASATAADAVGDVNGTAWQPLSPAARAVRSISGAITGVVLSAPAAALLVGILVGELGVAPFVVGLPAAVGATTAGALTGAWLGRLRWQRTMWYLDHIGLHVRRGLLWRTEILVPRSRVQHLDVERGPLERQFNLATLILHTAGTQTQALRLSGLDEPDAVALRDALIPDAARDVDAL